MLFTEQDLYVNNGLNILNEATYLSEDESIINPQTIPVKEVSRLGYGVVRFDDVDKLSEDYGIDYIDAMYMIAESSNMNPEYLAVSVPEEDIIAYPEIVNELANIVIQPLSEYDIEYQFVAECVEAWLESGDELYLEEILNEKGEPVSDLIHQIAAATNQTRSQVSKAASKLAKKQRTNLRNGLLSLAQSYNLNLNEPSATTVTPQPNRKVKTNTQQQETQPTTPQQTQNQDPRKPTGVFFDDEGRTYKKLGTGMRGRKRKPVQTPPQQDTPAVTSDNNNQSRLSRATTWVKNNKVKTALGVGLGAAAIGGGIYAYKQYKNKPRSVIAKRIAALRGIYKKFMLNAQKNPQKANVFKRIAAKILSVIDKLLHYLQNKADGR